VKSGPEAEGTPSPCFLQEYDSIGVKEWGYVKNMILWELWKEGRKLTADSLQSTAGTGRSEGRLKVDPSAGLPSFLSSSLWVDRARSLGLKGERFGELNAETQSAQRSEKEGTGTGLVGGAGRALRRSG
jgi:hypothetical protein